MRLGSWPGYGFDHNPFMKILLDGLAAQGAEIVSLETVPDLLRADLDAVLLQWSETVLWQSSDRWELMANIWRLRRYFAKPRGARPKLVWLAHNLAPHRQKRLQRLLWPSYMASLTAGVDGVLTLSPGTIAPVRAAFPNLAQTPMGAIWHPRYPAPRGDRAAARAAAGLPEGAHVLGYCGQIRSYKGVDLALEAFCGTQDPQLRFFLAGSPLEPDLAARLQAAAARDPRIVLRLEDLSAEAFEQALLCCDTVVAPFRNYLHSGSLIHALSAGCQILTPKTPFADSLAALLPQQVQLYDGALTPDQLLAQATRPRPVLAAGEDPLAALAPDQVAREALRFIDAL